MSNFQSYQLGQESTPQAPKGEGGTVRAYVHEGAQTATVVDGVMTDAFRGQEFARAGELNPHHGTDSPLATAQHPRGLPVTEIRPDTLVTIDGLQAPVSFWVSEGRLQRGPDGTYSDASPAQAAPSEVSEDFDALPQEAAGAVAQVFEGMEPRQVDAVMGRAIGVASGRLDASVALRTYGEFTGADPEEASAKIGGLMAVYQDQAARALQQRGGLAEADLPAFYEWAQTQRQSQLQDAISRQIYSNDMGGYRVLAERWMSEVPPSVEAFKAAGVPVRTRDGKPEVFLRGSWMSPSGAARAGLA